MNGPPQKPTSARSRLELAAHDPHGLEDRRAPLLRLGDAQPLDVRRGRDRLVDDRADALDELDVDPHPEDGRHDVREQDGRVDAVPAHRLQRHLGAELGRARELEEASASRAARGTPAASARPGA